MKHFMAVLLMATVVATGCGMTDPEEATKFTVHVTQGDGGGPVVVNVWDCSDYSDSDLQTPLRLITDQGGIPLDSLFPLKETLREVVCTEGGDGNGECVSVPSGTPLNKFECVQFGGPHDCDCS